MITAGVAMTKRRNRGNPYGTNPGRGPMILWMKDHTVHLAAIQLYYSSRANIASAKCGVGSRPNDKFYDPLLKEWEHTHSKLVAHWLSFLVPDTKKGQRTPRDKLLYLMGQKAYQGCISPKTSPSEGMLGKRKFDPVIKEAILTWPNVLKQPRFNTNTI